MDASKIVVLVLTLIAFGFLVWFEMNSRRNSSAEKETPAEQPIPEAQQQSPRKRR